MVGAGSGGLRAEAVRGKGWATEPRLTGRHGPGSAAGERDGETEAAVPAGAAAQPGSRRDGAPDDQCLQRCLPAGTPPGHMHPSPVSPSPPFPGDPMAHSPTLPAPRTPALAHPTHLAISCSSFTMARDPSPFSCIPWDGCLLVGGEQGSQTECAVFAPPPPAPGETGAMVSSTLKLGISILNGGNADVQQVTGARTWEESTEL